MIVFLQPCMQASVGVEHRPCGAPRQQPDQSRFSPKLTYLKIPFVQLLYLGSNKLHRSLDQGDNWETISGDLTQGGKKGNVAYGTLTTISESPLQFGLIYTGSDDGLVHVSKNGGGDWLQISDKLTKDLWVSRVIASQHQKERVYVALNGYRWDVFSRSTP